MSLVLLHSALITLASAYSCTTQHLNVIARYHCVKVDLELKHLEREPLRYYKCDGKVIFTRPFLMWGKVTFDDHVNALERYWKGDISYTFTKP